MQGSVLYGGSTTMPSFRGHFHRPRIDKLIGGLLDRYLIVVAAGAGSGKTHAVSSYLQNIQARVLWFQLSELDNNLTRFWEAFTYVMKFHNQETAAQLEQLGFPETILKFNKFLHILTKEIYSREQVVFVFDDFHLIKDESILRFVWNLISARLDNFCIIINTRSNPDYNLTGMLSNGLAGLITAEELYFTLDETEEYLSQIAPLPKREIESVHAFTQGWPLALYLVGLSIKKGGGVSKGPIAGAMPLVFDLIDRELFSHYAPQTQNFLIRASLLDSFPEELLRCLAGESAGSIMEHISDNMFIHENPYTGYYVFHHLFLEFLRGKRVCLSQRETDDTYLSAARWCAANDLKIEALTYFDRCGCYDEVLNMILNFGVAIFSKTIADFYIGLIDQLPSELVRKNPLLHVHRAGLLHNNAQVQPAMDELVKAQRELELLPPTQGNRAVLGEICCMLGLIKLGMADYGFIDLFVKASEYLPNGSGMIDHNGMAVNTRYAIMLNNPSPGELKRMEDALFFAMPYASKTMRGYGYGIEYLASAEAAYFTGNIKKASQSVHEAIYRAREKQVADVAASGYFLLMRMETANGNYEGVVSNLERMKAYVEGLMDKWNFNGMPDVAEAWFNLLLGSKESVAGWLVDDLLGDNTLAPYSVGIERLIKMKYWLREGRYYELLAWLAQAEKLLRQYNMWLSLLDLLIGKSIALHYIHEEAGSLAALREAYEIANGNNIIAQFVEHGNDMRIVIYSARRSGSNAIPHAWLDEIYTKASTYEKHLRSMRSQHRQTSGQAISPSIKFTKREQQILDYVCQGLTNAEIASACYITLSAVKKTLNNIYIKLGATNRADAVRTALQMKSNN